MTPSTHIGSGMRSASTARFGLGQSGKPWTQGASWVDTRRRPMSASRRRWSLCAICDKGQDRSRVERGACRFKQAQHRNHKNHYNCNPQPQPSPATNPQPTRTATNPQRNRHHSRNQPATTTITTAATATAIATARRRAKTAKTKNYGPADDLPVRRHSFFRNVWIF